jgi:hypothetical protein
MAQIQFLVPSSLSDIVPSVVTVAGSIPVSRSISSHMPLAQSGRSPFRSIRRGVR